MTSHINTRDLVAANLSVREALLASALADILDTIEQWRHLPLSAPEATGEYIAEKIRLRSEAAIKTLMARQTLGRHDSAKLRLIADIARLSPPSPLKTYPSEGHIRDYEQHSMDIADAAQSYLTNICSGMPVSCLTEMSTIFTNALHDREPFAGSIKWAQDNVESVADTRAEQRRALHVVE